MFWDEEREICETMNSVLHVCIGKWGFDTHCLWFMVPLYQAILILSGASRSIWYDYYFNFQYGFCGQLQESYIHSTQILLNGFYFDMPTCDFILPPYFNNTRLATTIWKSRWTHPHFWGIRQKNKSWMMPSTSNISCVIHCCCLKALKKAAFVQF